MDRTLSAMNKEERSCAFCLVTEVRLGRKLAVCSRCKSVRYCSAEHQKADWKSHKPICAGHVSNMAQSINEPAPSANITAFQLTGMASKFMASYKILIHNAAMEALGVIDWRKKPPGWADNLDTKLAHVYWLDLGLRRDAQPGDGKSAFYVKTAAVFTPEEFESMPEDYTRQYKEMHKYHSAKVGMVHSSAPDGINNAIRGVTLAMVATESIVTVLPLQIGWKEGGGYLVKKMRDPAAAKGVPPQWYWRQRLEDSIRAGKGIQD